MRGPSKILPQHLARRAYVYVRQSSPGQVLSHPESARRQRELADLAAGLGWPSSQIAVLDSDQGKTGQTAEGREAFKRILGDVSVGEVGIVVGIEVARLARNCADWFPLVEMCALTDTLIADEEGIYDPNDPNDRLVLGVKGTLSEAELHRIRTRLLGARWSLARRGELRRKIPTGYSRDERGHVVMDPDERVRSAIRSFFRRFEEVGSAFGLARAYAREGLLFPRRDFRGRWDGPVFWRALTVRGATLILHNPFYAGVYFYGERRAVTTVDPETKTRKTILRRLPLESWEVLRRDSHPAYLSWEQFLRNRQRLRENGHVKEGGPRAAREGSALLQGIACCGRCGRRMTLRYSGRDSYPLYICYHHTDTGEHVRCQSVAAHRVDLFVEERILDAIRPMGIEAAIAAVEELERRSADLRRQWEHRIQQADYDAGLARRRYEAVDPDNRLVAGNLERDWEEKLRELERLKKEHAERTSKPPIRIADRDRELLHELAEDLPRLWHAETTKSSDRKRVVRILVREVWLCQEDEPRQTRVRIHWQTGAVTEARVARPLPIGLRFTTPPQIVERILEMQTRHEHPKKIAETLDREGLRTAQGKRFTADRVRALLTEWRRKQQRGKEEHSPVRATAQGRTNG
jgi:DNA invertase Pin-like site-specific DNA recombinase